MGNKDTTISYTSYLKSLGCSIEFDKVFSSTVARIVFLLLLTCTLVWCGYALARVTFLSCLNGMTLLKSAHLKQNLATGSLSLRRAFICSLCLFSAVFSPGIGIMFACTYFIVHDPKALEELVPRSLRNQFLSFFKAPSEDCSHEDI